MPNTMSKEDFIREVVDEMRGSDLVSLNNEYCNETDYMDDYIEYMDMFDDIVGGYTPTEIAGLVADTGFSVNDNYFKFTIYGIESFDFPEDYIDIDAIVDYICENDNDLGDSDIRDALDEWEENENDHDSFRVDEWDEDEEVEEESIGRHSRLRMPKRESTKRVKRSRKINESFDNSTVEIKDWYKKAFPTDELGDYIRDGLTFNDLFEAMDNYLEVYAVLGVGDSIVRNRVFDKLAEIMGVDYEYIYDQWMKGNDNTTEEEVLAFLRK